MRAQCERQKTSSQRAIEQAPLLAQMSCGNCSSYTRYGYLPLVEGTDPDRYFQRRHPGRYRNGYAKQVHAGTECYKQQPNKLPNKNTRENVSRPWANAPIRDCPPKHITQQDGVCAPRENLKKWLSWTPLQPPGSHRSGTFESFRIGRKVGHNHFTPFTKIFRGRGELKSNVPEHPTAVITRLLLIERCSPFRCHLLLCLSTDWRVQTST